MSVEDDVRIIEGNIRHFAQAINTVPAKWNLAFFGYAQMNLSTPLSVRLKLMTYYPLLKMLGSVRHDPDTIRRIYLKYPIFDQRLDIASLIGARPSWKESQQQ